MREKSLKRKLTALVLLAVGGAQIVTALISLWSEAERFAANKRELLLTQAQVIAAAASKATAGHDRRGVYDALRAATHLPGVNFIAVEDLAGERIADLGAAEMLSSDLEIDAAKPLRVLDLLRSRSFVLRAPVVEGGVEVGAVTLIGDASDLKAHLRSGLLTTAAIEAAALALALAVAMRLQAAVTRPLNGLVRGMQNVARSHDYNLTLPPSELREVRILIDGFNTMLAEIRERDRRIAQSYAELEDQVRARTRELHAAKLSADAANAHKSEFLATMSHEIRTPLNGMLVMAELLARSPLPAAAQRYASVIWRSGRSLLAIINDVLDFSKIEAGKLELERAAFDLPDLVMTVLDLFAEKARGKGLDLAAVIGPEVPATLVGDSVRLTQVISNLVNNAVKFTERGHVCVRVSASGEAGRLRIAVVDTGIGIAPDKLESVFGAFSQADMSTTRKYGGSGLGLAICQRLVRAMGSQITVTSRIGEGAAFHFDLRIEEGERAAPQAPAVWSGAPVLIAASGDVTREALASGLAAAGAELALAGDFAPAEAGQIVIVDDGYSGEALQAAARRGARIVGVDRAGRGEGPRAPMEAMLSWPISARELHGFIAAAAEGRPLQIAAQVSPAGPSQDFAGLRALVADDSEVNQEVAKEALQRLGLSVTVVADGAAAVAALAQGRFDIVFMDGSMPVLDGFEATRRIREREAALAAPRTPIVALTAHVFGAGASEWREAGMDGLLSKPYTLQQLQECLEHALSGRERAPATGETGARDVALLDEAKLADLMGLSEAGNRNFLERIVGLYLEHAPKAVAALRGAVKAGQAADQAKAAHSLKSMSLNIAATAAAALADRLEAAAKSGETLTEAEVDRLGETVEATCSELGRMIARVPSEQVAHERGRSVVPAKART